jgi:hypothetical protein
MEELNKKKPVIEIVQKMKQNNEEKHHADGSYAARQEYKKEAAEALAASHANAPVIEYPEGPAPEDIPF